MNQKVIKLQGEIDKYTVVVDCNILPSINGRKSR